VHCCHSAEPDAGLDFAMTAYLDVVAHDNLVFNQAVVAYMNTNHKEIIIADSGKAVGIHAGVDCDLFANYVSIAYNEAAYRGVGFQAEYLRLAADCTGWKKLIAASNPDVWSDEYICVQNGIGADFDTTLDNTVGSDCHSIGQLNGFIYYRTRMYLNHFYFSHLIITAVSMADLFFISFHHPPA
jgi:hypothetical protein